MLLRGYRRGAGRSHEQHVQIVKAQARARARQEAARIAAGTGPRLARVREEHLNRPAPPRGRRFLQPHEPVDTRQQRFATTMRRLEQRGANPVEIQRVLNRLGLTPMGHGRFGTEQQLAAQRTALERALSAIKSALTIHSVGSDEGGGLFSLNQSHGPKAVTLAPKFSAAGVAPAVQPIGEVTKNLAEDVNQSAIGFVPSVVQMFQHPVGTAKAVANQYRYTYGPLFGNHPEQTLQRVKQHPLGPLLDAYAAGSLLTKGLEVGLGRTVARERELGIPGTAGGTVQPPGSPNALTRVIEHRYDKFSERHPHTPVVGAESRVARRLPQESERDLERLKAVAIPFQVARKAARVGLRPDIDHAYDLFHRYGPAKAAEYLDHEIAFRRERIASEDVTRAEKFRQNNAIVLLRTARRHLTSAKVARLWEQGQKLAAKSQQARLAHGDITPEAAAERPHESARLVTGGQYTPIPGESPALRGARTQVGTLQKRFDKAELAREKSIQRELVRQGKRAAKIAEQRKVPRTMESARAALMEMRKTHEGLLKRAVERELSVPMTPEEATTRLADVEREIGRWEQAQSSGPLLREGEGLANQEVQRAKHNLDMANELVRQKPGITVSQLEHALDTQFPGATGVSDVLDRLRMLHAHYGGESQRYSKRTIDKTLRELKAERTRLTKARDTGLYRQPLDKGETAYRNLFNSKVRKGRAGFRGERNRQQAGMREAQTFQELPSQMEEIRHRVEQQLIAGAKRTSHHPSSRAFLAHLEEMDRLAAGLNRLEEKYQFGTGHPTVRELVENLGHEPPGRAFDKDLNRLTKRIAALEAKGASEQELAPLRDVRDHLVAEGKVTLPHRVGNTVIGPMGETLQPHEATVGRLGGALSVAKDRLTNIENRYRREHGMVPAPKSRPRTVLLGGQPAEGTYISSQRKLGRRSATVRIARSLLGKKPKQSYQYQSLGKLFTEARTQRGSKVVLGDWLRTVRSIHRDRDVAVAATFTKPLDPEAPNLGLLEKHRVFDPEGLLTPKVKRNLMEEQGLSRIEQLTPQELDAAARADYKETMDRIFLDPAKLEGTDELRQAIEDGKVAQIPDKVVAAFARGDNLPFAGITQTDAPVAHALVEGLDLANNITRLGVLWLKGSFVPLNFAGNLIFLTLEHPVRGPAMLGRSVAGAVGSSTWVPARLTKGLQLLSQTSPENLRRIDVEVGSGAAVAVAGEGTGPLGRITKAVGHFSNLLADQAPRRAAWLSEAWARGYRTDAALTRLLKEPKLRRELNQISETAERSMVQFRHLTPIERRIITRAIFIYPWMKGATRYFVRYPIDRPIQASITTRMGQEGYDKVHQQLGELVSYLQGVVGVGPTKHLLGTEVVPVIGTQSMSPLTTGLQVTQAIAGLAAGHSVPKTLRLVAFIQPQVKAILGAAQGINVDTGVPYPGDQGFLENVLSAMQNQYALERVFSTLGSKPQTAPFTGSPATQRLYVGEGGWQAALKEFFLGSARVRYLNVPAQAAKQHAEARSMMSAMERAHDDVKQLTAHVLEGAAKTKLPIVHNGKLSPWVQDTLAAYASRKLNRLQWSHDNKVHGTLTKSQKLQADVALLGKLGKLSPTAVKNITRFAIRYGTYGTTGPRGIAADHTLANYERQLGKLFFYSAQMSLLKKALLAKGYRLQVPSA